MGDSGKGKSALIRQILLQIEQRGETAIVYDPATPADYVPYFLTPSLYRINAQSEVYEQALTEAGIPYQVRGGEGFFQRPEVRQGVQALRQAARGDLPDARGAD